MFPLAQRAPSFSLTQNRKQGRGKNPTQEKARGQEGARTCGQFRAFHDKGLLDFLESQQEQDQLSPANLSGYSFPQPSAPQGPRFTHELART